MHYYAILDEKGLVINFISYSTEQTASNLVEITEEQYNNCDSLYGLYYDPDLGDFITPPVSVLADMSTSAIQYKSENKWLDAKLDEIEQAIQDIELTPGPAGASAYEVAVENGFNGTKAEWLLTLVGARGDTGATGPQGPAGASAYEVAVANGYTGTESEWLASLGGSATIDAKRLFTGDTGGIKEVITTNVTTYIANKTTGVYTFQSNVNVAGAPNSTEIFRYICHKTSATQGWVIAFGQSGSVYTNYDNNGTWTGWKAIYTQESPLWSGGVQMVAADTVTPSKKLDECAHGWVLMWSDYNEDTSQPAESDIATTLVPKKNASGSNWNGQDLYALLPTYVSVNQAVTVACKRLKIYNNRIVGYDLNEAEPANDVVLRAIYEY